MADISNLLAIKNDPEKTGAFFDALKTDDISLEDILQRLTSVDAKDLLKTPNIKRAKEAPPIVKLSDTADPKLKMAIFSATPNNLDPQYALTLLTEQHTFERGWLVKTRFENTYPTALIPGRNFLQAGDKCLILYGLSCCGDGDYVAVLLSGEEDQGQVKIRTKFFASGAAKKVKIQTTRGDIPIDQLLVGRVNFTSKPATLRHFYMHAFMSDHTCTPEEKKDQSAHPAP